MVIVQQVKKFTKPDVKKQVDDFELKVSTAGQAPIPEDSGPVLKGISTSGLSSLQRPMI